MRLELKKFDMASLASDSVVCMLGKRKTGKSHIVKNLLSFHAAIPVATIISATEMSNGFYSKFVPSIFIHTEYSPEVLENFVKRQKMVCSKKSKEISQFGGSQIDTRAIILLDDCMFDNSWTTDKNIRLIFMNGRHWGIFFLMTSQMALGIPPALRTNIDYTFICRENSIKNRRKIYENYASMFDSFDVFCQVLDQTTENFCCLVVKNNVDSNKLEDQVFWYKAPPDQNFKICSKEFWDMNEAFKKEEEYGEAGEKEYMGGALNVKKRQESLTVVRKGDR